MDDDIAAWVAARCPNVHYGFVPGHYRAVGVGIDGVIVAGFVFTDWHPEFGTMDISLAADSPRWATRRTVAGILAYPFIERDCQRVTVVTGADNHKALRLAEGVGFTREAVIERGYGIGRDAVLLRLFKEDWASGPYGMRQENG